VTDAAAAGSSGNADLAYREIRRAILEGRYRAGQRLIERQISEELHLSRTPVRESIRRLEAEGLVLTERNRGAIVRTVTEVDIVDVYELRAPLEALAARRAAARATVDDLGELDRVIAMFDRAIQMSDPVQADAIPEVDEANGEFHRCVLRIAAHSRLTHLLAGAVDLPSVVPARTFSTAERVRSNLFHRLIRDAVAAHEPDRAARLMSEHIFMARDTVLAHLREQKVQPVDLRYR
jgi:DNA-binding GntR family transcriptional regulator